MAELWNALSLFFMKHWWLVQLLGIIFLTMCISFIEKKIYLKIYPRLLATDKMWDDAFLFALHKPLRVIIWFFGFLLCLDVVLGTAHSTPRVLEILHLVEDMLGVVLFVWFLIRYISEMEVRFISRISSNGKIDRSTIHAIGQISRITAIVITALIGLQIFGVPIAGLLAFGGIGGLALGFAAKDTLANFFGGFMIFFDRPFTVGDWICSPDKDIEGTVEDIGWRLTRIRRFDRRPLYVPNGTFSTIGVINASRMTNRRIFASVGVRYDDAEKILPIVNEAENMLKSHPDIDADQTCFVKFNEFASSSLNFQIYAFTKTTAWKEYLSVQQDIFLKVIEIITKYGAQCAFPTTTLECPTGIDVTIKSEK